MRSRRAPALLALLAAVLPRAADAGVVNPDISVIGQPVLRYTDDPADAGGKRPQLDAGETEFDFEAYLNPAARGTFVVALAEGSAELEEGYFSLLRGLPLGLALKGGKYRVGFGKLNPVHPHAYPFAERFHLLAAYLPGDESLNETGVSLSGRLPAPGEVSVTLTGDWLQGDTFRIERESSGDPTDPIETGAGDRQALTRPAFVGRLSVFAPLGERSGLELGASAARGTNNVAARAHTRLYGADVKAKLWRSAQSCLALQGELVRLSRDEARWDPTAGYRRGDRTPHGGCLFADCQCDLRRDVGVSFERYQEPVSGQPWSQAFGVFGGYSILEETTVFRLGWERFRPAGDAAVNTVTFRVLYSMGPHKAHHF